MLEDHHPKPRIRQPFRSGQGGRENDAVRVRRIRRSRTTRLVVLVLLAILALELLEILRLHG